MSARASSRSMMAEPIQFTSSRRASNVQKDGRGRPRWSVIRPRRDFGGRGFSTRQGGRSPALSSRWSGRTGLFGSGGVAMGATVVVSSVTELEHLREEAFPLALLTPEMTEVAVVVIVVVTGAARGGGGVPFDELVELAAVEPDTAALRAV